MNQEKREERLLRDLEAMESLQAESSILQFTTTGDPPNQYLITFQGRTIRRESSRADVSIEVGQQQCEIRLPYSYPRLPPDIRWTTPIFHPNVSFSGFFKLSDAGIQWRPEWTLDVVCAHLWDVARLATHQADAATNYAALKWLETPEAIVPVDVRSLRDIAQAKNPNIVRYQRKGASQPAPRASAADILYIDENTPLPPLARGDDADTLYIGFD